jgi:hypothetical protein
MGFLISVRCVREREDRYRRELEETERGVHHFHDSTTEQSGYNLATIQPTIQLIIAIKQGLRSEYCTILIDLAVTCHGGYLTCRNIVLVTCYDDLLIKGP